MDFEMDNEFNDVTNIKVIGVGGGCLLYTSSKALPRPECVSVLKKSAE